MYIFRLSVIVQTQKILEQADIQTVLKKIVKLTRKILLRVNI